MELGLSVSSDQQREQWALQHRQCSTVCTAKLKRYPATESYLAIV